MIVKVQRPVFQSPGDAGPDIVVYGEGHAHQQLVAASDLPGWLVDMLEVSPKVYATAVWSLKRGWEFTGAAKWQSW